MSLTGSRFSSDSAPRPFHHGGSKVQSQRNCHVADGFLHPSLSPPKGEADRGDQRRSSEQAGCGLNDCTSRAARRQGDRCRRVELDQLTSKSAGGQSWSESALTELGLKNRNDPATTQVAKLIIQLAKDGHRDPKRLAGRATGIVRGSS